MEKLDGLQEDAESVDCLYLCLEEEGEEEDTGLGASQHMLRG